MLDILRRLLLVVSTGVLGVTLLATPDVSAAPNQDQHSAIYDSVFFDENEYNFPTCGEGGAPATGTGTGGATGKVPVNFSLGTNATERQANLVKTLAVDYGLTPAQAAGIVGNFMHESGGKHLPPDVNEGGSAGPPRFSGGYGWAQWTGPRQRTFINYAVRNGYMASSSVRATDGANYAYLKSELNTGYKSTITALRKITSGGSQEGVAQNAAVSFEATFERAGVPALGPRKANAVTAYKAYMSVNGGGGITTQAPPETPSTPDPCAAAAEGGAAIVGNYGFPLGGSKKVVKNPGMFRNGTADLGGHPYTAYDILANPGTPVLAFMSGKVTHIGTDKCPGRLISIYNKESNMTVSYLHLSLSGHVAEGATVAVGQKVGVVGSAANGCGTPHLHLDVAKGTVRPGCKREDCPAANAAKFVNVGPQLYQTYQKLPN